MRTIMNSDDVMGGSTTFTMISTTQRFHDENPKTYGAFVAALKDAQGMIAANPREAATVLLASMGGRGVTVDELLSIMADPGTKYTIVPENVLKYAHFMHEIGSLRRDPNSIADLFIPDPDTVRGN